MAYANWIQKIVLALYRLLISLKLAVLLIMALIVVLAAGTIIESLHGAAAARILIYNSSWFSAIIVFLVLNVLSVALSRLPWRKKHVGFVMTHCGILMILTGSLITKYYMIDGQIAITKGDSESQITLPQSFVMVQSEDRARIWVYRVPQKAFSWEGRDSMGDGSGPFSLYLLNFYPQAEVVEGIKGAARGPAALHVRLYNDRVDYESWIVKGDPRMGSIDMGPARIVFAEEFLKKAPTEDFSEESYLAFQIGESTVSVPVKEGMELPATVPLKDTSYKVTLYQVFRHGVVAGGKLIDRAEETGSNVWVNPAVKLRLEGEGIREEHTVFAKFPDFPTIHGHAPKPSGVSIRFHVPGVDEIQAASHEIRFVNNEDGKLMVQLKSNNEITTGEVAVGQDVETGWMDLNLHVSEFFPHSETEFNFIPRPNTSDQEGLASAIRLKIGEGDEKEEVWLHQGKHKVVRLGDKKYTLTYSLKRIPMGFKLKLVDFIKTNYPGTDNPASFSSDVVLMDAMHGVSKEAHISMNEPLDYRGFKIYQSGYLQVPGEPEVSIFAVSRDPGILVTYAGSIVMILGIIVMIVLKKQVRT
ncbi:MAG: cytochrome c biogenesis protein ResB [Waddliaceae bacterium]